MSTFHLAKIKKEYLFGFEIHHQSTVPIRTLDDFIYIPFISLLKIKCDPHSVYASFGFICGFKCKTLVDNKAKVTKSISKTAKVHAKVVLKLNKDEHLMKAKFGYNDKGVKAVKLVTDYQKKQLGEVKLCEYKAESSSSRETAVIGFEFVMNNDKIVEAGVFIAPILSKINANDYNYRRKSSLMVFNDDATPQTRLSASVAMVKHVFKAYKNLKLNTSY
jgi:hypothetical protein